MIEHRRHVPLSRIDWSESEVAAAIEDIVADALAHFDAQRFWPAHPLDENLRDGHTGLYMGATGVMWGIDYLRSVGASRMRFDLRPVLPRLMQANRAELPNYGNYAAHGSLLFGDLGTALLAMRLAPSAEIADRVHARANANTALPVRELMWGLPGSMIACVHMAAMTGEARWRELFSTQAARLLAELVETDDGPLWTQDLYGRRQRYLGPVHGYAGNMIALMRGWAWLAEDQRARIAAAVPATLARNAWRSELGASWPAVVAGGKRPPWLCQHCHGAPGMVTTFADAPFTSPELEELLREGARFTWAAGPLSKGSNLCHGTGGNGHAFLKLYRRSNEAVWLERARAFAMTAIAQYREARERYGRGRYSLWTGDIGLALYLWDCLTMEPKFPTVDVF
ncbi:MAG: LanC-like protein [Alphaproteobacteria bacterium]|nr:LanC-like protein [Alphaproteobacteria bacterium]MBV8407425.1 LanC-like protein [Alphaproteobacteria bacterium]